MIKFFLFSIWTTTTCIGLMYVMSCYVFDNNRNIKRLGRQILVCFCWPVFLLSRNGRNQFLEIMKENE